MDGWKESLLNQAGKEVLKKAVQQAIPAYAMSMVRFPKGFCKNICSIIAKFWWTSHGKNRGIYWKQWRALAKSKKEGGIGFKDFEYMNSTHLAKQTWRTITDPDALWVQYLKSVYFPNLDIWRARRKRQDSWTWASFIHGRDMIKNFAQWLVGNGQSIDIDLDRWMANGKFVQNLSRSSRGKVNWLIDSVNFCWDRGKIRNLFRSQDAIDILRTPIRRVSGQDVLWLPHSKTWDILLDLGTMLLEIWIRRQIWVRLPQKEYKTRFGSISRDQSSHRR